MVNLLLQKKDPSATEGVGKDYPLIYSSKYEREIEVGQNWWTHRDISI